MNGGDIFRLSKVLGHSSVKITQDRYAHLMPEAFEQDYQRVAFVVPTERANLHQLHRDEAGRIVGRTAVGDGERREIGGGDPAKPLESIPLSRASA